MYHRINTAVSDTWQLAVSPACFQQQLEVLHDYNVVSMQQLTSALQQKNLKHKSIAITFDDGYIDNYQVAKPLLEQYNFPATFFITNSLSPVKKEFWWDALEYILLESNSLPSEIKLHFNQEDHWYNLTQSWQEIISAEELSWVASWLPWQTPPTSNHAFFLQLSEIMKGLSLAEKENVISQLYALAALEPIVRIPYQLMSKAELLSLSSNALFEVGGHSANHVALGKFDKSVQQEEITSNQLFLQMLLQKNVTGYGYAHGSYNNDSKELLKQQGFAYSCTTEHAAVSNNSEAFSLPRLQVKNWNKALFKENLDKLLTL